MIARDDPPEPDEQGDAALDDDRATEPPAETAEPEPTPGEDPGPRGNPAQDEESLSHQQQESSRAGQDET